MRTKSGRESMRWPLIIVLTILPLIVFLDFVSPACDLSFLDDNKLYNYTLASPIPKFPHGVLSEDGFYKVAVNDTVLWFQLCDGMIFNHERPGCVDCWDCGGPSRCGMGCNALAANNIGGYYVCTTIGNGASIDINIIDRTKPHIGVVVKMSSMGPKFNCSLSVSVLCDLDKVQGPNSLQKFGTCDYATELRHPSACAHIIHVRGRGWGWFTSFLTIVLCLFGGYLLAGTVYRFFILGVRGIDVIPNLDFWATLPHKAQSLFASLVRKLKGPSQGYRSSYSAVNF